MSEQQRYIIAQQHKTLSLARDVIAKPENIGMHENSITITSAFNSNSLSRDFKGNEPMAFAVVKLLTERFLKSFGFSKTHESVTVDIIATDILNEMKHESLEDIILFLRMARTGSLGVTNRGLDSNIIIGEWLPKYMELKAEERELQWQKEKDSHKKFGEVDVMATYSEAAQRKKAELEIEAVKKRIEEITKGITREQLEKTIELWQQTEMGRKYIDLLKRKRLEIK